jgi:dTDP-4-amino-4,6-dideoxygalactose transaminase
MTGHSPAPVAFFDLARVNARHRAEFADAFGEVLDAGRYVLGRNVAGFEEEFARYCGTQCCVGMANGLDALRLTMRAWMELGMLREGDEVIVPANTFIASILAITDCRLTPVLVEPDEGTYNVDASAIERAISPRTRLILVVHLYGRLAPVEAIADLSRGHGLLMLEDAAQAHGAEHLGRRAGAWGDAAAFSFYPTKNLGAMGDGGAVTTDDARLAETVRALGNYGCTARYRSRYKGWNSRLDEMQAAFLRVKLRHLDQDNEQRRQVAERYLHELSHPSIHLPISAVDYARERRRHVWHLFVVRSSARDRLQAHLTGCGIESLIHYPIPPHRQEAYAEWNHRDLPLTERLHDEVLSLPISPAMTDAEVDRVVAAVNGFA